MSLGEVDLAIKGVQAQALLKVRLDNVAKILGDVLQTLDHNPQILENLTRGLGNATEQIGTGAGQAVGEIGKGASSAVSDVGSGAGDAVRDVGSGPVTRSERSAKERARPSAMSAGEPATRSAK